jgi:hypothetical protein
MPRSSLLIAFLLAGAGSLGGCSDPYLREGTWHAAGVNEENLHAMLAEPADMQWGVSQPGSNGQLAAGAVERLRTGQVRVLSSDSIPKVGAGAAQSPPASPGTGGS